MITPDRCLIFPSVDYVRNIVNKQGLKNNIPVVIDCRHIYGADYTVSSNEKNLFFHLLKLALFLFRPLLPSIP